MIKNLDANQADIAPMALDLLRAHALLAEPERGASAQQAGQEAWERVKGSHRAAALIDRGQAQWLAAYDKLEFDSRVFQRPMARLEPLAHRRPWPEPGPLAQGRELLGYLRGRAHKEGVQCMVARTPAKDMLSAQALEGEGWLLQDVSVELALGLAGLGRAPSLPRGFEVRAWRQKDQGGLLELAESAFCQLDAYADRFAMDPGLRKGCGRLYRQWMANSLSGEQADMVLTLAHGEEPAGFVTLRLPPQKGGEATVVLNAIAPEFRGQGLYKPLLTAGLSWLGRQGAGSARVRTKTSQTAVINTWAGLGARQVHSDMTFHLWLGSCEPA